MAEARAAYRHCMRAVSSTFKGDAFALSSARSEIRTRFAEDSAVSDPAVIKTKIGEAYEAATFLKSFIAQGKLNERGNFEVSPTSAEEDFVLTKPEDVKAPPTKADL